MSNCPKYQRNAISPIAILNKFFTQTSFIKLKYAKCEIKCPKISVYKVNIDWRIGKTTTYKSITKIRMT